MGFGYLFIGYLVTFVLSLPVAKLGFGGLALLVGYAVMYYALWLLSHYNRSFLWAKYTLIPLLVTAVYEFTKNFDELLLWQSPVFSGVTATVMEWLTFALILFFNLSLLYGIRMLSYAVGLGHMSVAAVRNACFVVLYSVLLCVTKLPVSETVKVYLSLPVVLLDIVWIFCNHLLILSCAKNICPAGDEDQPAKPYRFAFLNRIGEAYERNREKSIRQTTEQVEDYLRRKKAKSDGKKNRNSHKKRR